jgi:hypothetical protein
MMKLTRAIFRNASGQSGLLFGIPWRYTGKNGRLGK